MNARVRRFCISVSWADGRIDGRMENDHVRDSKAAAAAIQALYLASIPDDAKSITIEVNEVEQ